MMGTENKSNQNPMAESTGTAAVREQRPKEQRSWMAKTRFIFIESISLPVDFRIRQR